MRTAFFLAAATALGFAEAANNMLAPYGGVYKRQAFDPDETTGSGANCVEAFGAGYIECVPQTDTAPRLCINPDLGETCCDNKWGCPGGSFCLVQDLCCPDGLDPKTCAAQNDVTLPPDFAIPSATSGSSPGPSVSSKPSSIVDSPKPSVTYGYGSGNHTGGKPPVVTAGASHERSGVAVAAVVGIAAALVL
ncbi:hypothetical protein B0T16DRAFT_456047 [Cercophora newfieldiana]|uniref:Uncharacterized protein n=1 Tax=Cercophora newfieldiana TaxID=92897 RepID=A0AA39YAW4_9PEZI|nr:hypothetical protein B0T16DRAFT_456047 [Cercophora newfieldiana]